MKIYGNSKSDGFALLATVVMGLFMAGGVGLATVGASSLLVGLPVLAVLVGVMVVQLKKWDVMSEVPAASSVESGKDSGTPVRLPNFPVAAVSDASATPVVAAWSPSTVNDSGLPSPVEKPKSAVVTNTEVA